MVEIAAKDDKNSKNGLCNLNKCQCVFLFDNYASCVEKKWLLIQLVGN